MVLWSAPLEDLVCDLSELDRLSARPSLAYLLCHFPNQECGNIDVDYDASLYQLGLHTMLACPTSLCLCTVEVISRALQLIHNKHYDEIAWKDLEAAPFAEFVRQATGENFLSMREPATDESDHDKSATEDVGKVVPVARPTSLSVTLHVNHICRKATGSLRSDGSFMVHRMGGNTHTFLMAGADVMTKDPKRGTCHWRFTFPALLDIANASFHRRELDITIKFTVCNRMLSN